MTRVVAVYPEPTPYRAPLFDLIASRREVELCVVYAARTVAGHAWALSLGHRARFLRGVRLPGARRVLRHEYPLTPGIVRLLEREQPEVVVACGWSTFASQVAIVWCRLRRVPYLVAVESHDHDPRRGWRRAVKRAIVPRVLRGAAGVLVTGTLSRSSVISYGVDPHRTAIFANTVDVGALAETADRLSERRRELRAAIGLAPGDIAVLSVARLIPEKNLDTLIRAVAAAGTQLRLVVAGEGPERDRLEHLANGLGVRLTLLGNVAWDRVVEVYAACDVFALLSRHEPWGVVVNEAAACGLPLVLSDHVGAAHDLLRPGENGVVVSPLDVTAAAAALRTLADDSDLRTAAGAASRRIAAGWGYGPSVDGFVHAVLAAAGTAA